MYKLPTIKHNGTLYEQLEKVKEELREIEVEMNRHPVDPDRMYFEILDAATAIKTLLAQANIPKDVYKKWVKNMNNKAYEMEWK